MGGISIWQLAIVAIIVVLLFGTKKLRNLGGDLGSSIKGFKNALNEENKSTETIEQNDAHPEVIIAKELSAELKKEQA